MLCLVCKDIVDRRWELIKLNVVKQTSSFTSVEPFEHKHHRTLATLQASAAQGCYVCATVWDLLSREEKSFLVRSCNDGGNVGNVTSCSVYKKNEYGIDGVVLQVDFDLAIAVGISSRYEHFEFVIENCQGSIFPKFSLHHVQLSRNAP